jgi:hypothetical protein
MACVQHKTSDISYSDARFGARGTTMNIGLAIREPFFFSADRRPCVKGDHANKALVVAGHARTELRPQQDIIWSFVCA